MTRLRVLVACEQSGIVRDAFAARGHDAWSCDIVPARRNMFVQHIMADVLTVLDQGWDLMIAHPPCTYLSHAGIGHWHRPGRKANRDAAMEFVMRLWNAPIEHICIENPRGHINNELRPADQTIQPWWFGDAHCKRTCLWLKNLPSLQWSEETACEKPEPCYVNPSGSKKYAWMERQRGSRARSVSFQGIADAMADQWGALQEIAA